MELLKFLKLKDNKKRIVCIDFGGDSVKVASLEERGDGFVLLAYALKEFQASHKTTEEVSTCLKQVTAEHSITGKEAYLSFSDPDGIFIKKFTLPQMPKEELFDAMKWQLKGEFPFNLDESEADLEVVREYMDNEGAKKIDLFCVFVKKEVVNKYASVLSTCGFEPVKITSSVFNYCGILSALPDNPKISATFDIGHSHSNIAIYQDNKLCFIRSLNFSTSKLSSSLERILVTDEGKVDVDPEKSRQLLQNYGILLDTPMQLQWGIKAGQIIPLMRPLLETVVKELGHSFEYFKSESGSEIPEVLYITGGGANLKNFDIYLTQQLKIKTIKLPLPGSLDIKNVDRENFLSNLNQFSGVLGLGLSVSKLNLLPHEIRSQKSELIQKFSLRIVAIVTGILFLFSWALIQLQINDYNKRLKIARQHLQGIEEIRVLKGEVDSKEGLINRMHAGKMPSGGLLKLMCSVVPADIMLDEFTFSQVTNSLTLKGVVLPGKDPVEKILTDFMKKVESSKFVLEANLTRSKEADGMNTFEIKCSLAK